MKKLLRLFIMAMLVAGFAKDAMSQIYFVNYAYDANGNRISRRITFSNDYRGVSSDTTAVECLTDNISDCDVSIFPNPAKEKVSLKLASYKDDKKITATLYSPLEICIERKNICSDMTSFDLSVLSSGTYILELSDDNEKRIWKIIKE